MTPEEIRARLADRNLRRVALAAGIHPITLYRFMSEKSNPLSSTVAALTSYLEQQDGRPA